MIHSGKNIKIFIVDGDPITRELYRQYLSNMGFGKIDLFENGQECIKKFDKKIPDLVFVDHHLTSADCLEHLKRIKHISPDIYIVFLAEPSEIELAKYALKLGAFDYIIKGEKDEEMIRSVVGRIQDVMKVFSKMASA
jgi:DNA-binding NtrC family response regulator